jgi:hypothetical protein
MMLRAWDSNTVINSYWCVIIMRSQAYFTVTSHVMFLIWECCYVSHEHGANRKLEVIIILWGLENYQVGFEVLTAVCTKMAVFWVLAPCGLVEVSQRFRGPCCLHHQGAIWNVGKLLPDYTALQSRRQPSFRKLPVSVCMAPRPVI